LEYFSDNQLLGWRARGEDVQKYDYPWYFELESQLRRIKQNSSKH